MSVLPKESTAEAPSTHRPEEVARTAKRKGHQQRGTAVVFPAEISFVCAECGTRIISSTVTLPVLLCSDHVGRI